MNYTLHKQNNFGEFDRKKPNVPNSSSSNVDNKQFLNHSDRKNSNIDEINRIAQVYSHKSPKEEFHFENKLLNRCNSTGKVLLRNFKENAQPQKEDNNENRSHNDSRDHSYLAHNNSRISNQSSVGQYLDRRHQDAQAKLNKLRVEKFQREVGNYEFTPKISENSKKIVSRLMTNENTIQIEPKRIINQDYNYNCERTRSPIAGKQNKLVRNNSQINVKSNLSSKLTKTIDELNDYKRIIEKRELILKEEQEKEKISEYNERKEQPQPLNIRKRPSSTNPNQRNENKSLNSNNNFNPITTNNQANNNSKINSNNYNNHVNTIENRNNNTFTNNNNAYLKTNIQTTYANTNKNNYNLNINTVNNQKTPAPIMNTINYDKDFENKKYYDYNPEKVINSRTKLNEYLQQKRVITKPEGSNILNNNNRQYNDQELNQPKKLFKLNNYEVENKNLNENFNSKNTDLYTNTNMNMNMNKVIRNEEPNRQNIPITGSRNNLPINSKSEKNLNLNVDFNHLDQFSPPNNNNVNNITYNIQKAYSNNLINNDAYLNSYSNIYGNNYSSNYTNPVTNNYTISNTQQAQAQNKNKNTQHNKEGNKVAISNHKRQDSVQSKTNNKKQEDLDYFKNYIDNMKIQNKKENNFVQIKKQVPEASKNDSSDVYKLNPSSKSYALEKMMEMKAKAGAGNSSQAQAHNFYSFRK